jgi:3-deoxy-D-manno-octulosonate 8-phosphate phosphatase (KDO 8-P phosphatase)
MDSFIDLFSKIRLVVMDMDGVLTDGKLLLLDDSNWVRKMDIKDGYSIQYAIKKGIKISVVSGSFSEDIAQVHGLLKEEILFIGDDIPDLSAFQAVGLRACPADAVAEVKERADYISRYNGGDGCVRDVLEKILKVQGLWNLGSDIASI